MGSCEKFKTFNFFHCFWLEKDRNLVMADLVSHFEGMRTFFMWKYLILLHFLNLKTPIEDSRLRHGRDFETPFLYRTAVTGLLLYSGSEGVAQMVCWFWLELPYYRISQHRFWGFAGQNNSSHMYIHTDRKNLQ